MRIEFRLDIPNGEFVTGGWQSEVRDVLRTYFGNEEVTLHISDIPRDDDELPGTTAEYNSATDEFTPV